MANIVQLPIHIWQSICQYSIYSHPKPKDFTTSLAQFRDIMRLRAICFRVRDLIDDCYLLFALSNSCNYRDSVKFGKALRFMNNSKWKFYWLHFVAERQPRKEITPLIGYEKLFAGSLQVLKIDPWFVFKTDDFKFLDLVTSHCCSYQTRIEIKLNKIGDGYNVPYLGSGEMVTSLNILSVISASDLLQLAFTFRKTLLTVESQRKFPESDEDL